MRTATTTFTSKRPERRTGERDTCSQSSVKGGQPRSGAQTSSCPQRRSMLDPVLAEPCTPMDLLPDAQNIRQALSRGSQFRGRLSQLFVEEERQVVRGGDCRTSARHSIDRRFANRMAVLRRLVSRLAHDEDRALRLVAERLKKAWAGRGRCHPDAHLHAWFFTILRNTFLSEMRRLRNGPERANGSFSAQADKSRNDEPAVTLSQFVSALATLPDGLREALILVGGAGYSQAEAAIACNCGVGTLRGRLFRARTRIAETLYSSAKGKAPGFLTFPTEAVGVQSRHSR